MQGSETQVRWSVAAVAELLEEQRFAEARTAAATAVDAAGENPELVLLAAFAAGEVERHYGDPGRAFQHLDRALTVCQGLAVAGTEPTLRAATCHLAWAEVALHVPDVPPEALKRVAATSMGVRRYENKVDERLDPRGQRYYWLGGAHERFDPIPDSDGQAIERGYASVTPIQADLTSWPALARLHRMDVFYTKNEET